MILADMILKDKQLFYFISKTTVMVEGGGGVPLLNFLIISGPVLIAI